jgi:hypothetical protein
LNRLPPDDEVPPVLALPCHYMLIVSVVWFYTIGCTIPIDAVALDGAVR